MIMIKSFMKRTKALQDKSEAPMPLERHQRQKLRRAELKEIQREVEARRRREDEATYDD
jgi:hypothetical protein